MTGAIAATVIVAIVGTMALLRGARPCLARINLDPAAVEPLYLVIMNPMRDRSPEREADKFFRQLAAGHVRRLEPFFGPNRQLIVVEEVRYPPVSWTVNSREDTNDNVSLSYRVKRGGGYPVVGDAQFEVTRSPAWKVTLYNATY